MENGGGHFPGRLSGCNGFESDRRSDDCFLAFYYQERNLQCLRGRPFDLDCTASGHAGPSPLAFKGELVNLLGSDWPLQNENKSTKDSTKVGPGKVFQTF